MERAEPEILCIDYWPPEQLTPAKLRAYQALIRERQITKPRVIYCRSARSTTVEYLTAIPHEWVLQELAQRANQ